MSQPMGDPAEDAILEACRQHPSGLTNDALKAETAELEGQVRMNAINSLLATHKINLFKSPDSGDLVYKEADAAQEARTKGLGSEELLVLQFIGDSGDMGIWTRDLKQRTNLQQPQVTKILKLLEQRQLVKAVKSVQSKNRKVYMLFETEPSREITGGAWYTDHEFDDVFVNNVRRTVILMIDRGSVDGSSLTDITESLAGAKSFSVTLRESDIKEILNTLVCDQLVTKVPSNGADDASVYVKVPEACNVPSENPLSRAAALLTHPDYNNLVEEYSRSEFPLRPPTPPPLEDEEMVDMGGGPGLKAA